MLSDNIRSLKEKFLQFETKGMLITPQAMPAFLAVLETMQLDAEAMERTVIAPDERVQRRARALLQGQPRPANVISFSVWKARRATRAPAPDDGGRAA